MEHSIICITVVGRQINWVSIHYKEVAGSSSEKAQLSTTFIVTVTLFLLGVVLVLLKHSLIMDILHQLRACLSLLLLVTVFSGSMSSGVVQGKIKYFIKRKIVRGCCCCCCFFIIIIIKTKQNKNCADCGTSVRRSRQPRADDALGRIIHGRQSVRGAWPWQVKC